MVALDVVALHTAAAPFPPAAPPFAPFALPFPPPFPPPPTACSACALSLSATSFAWSYWLMRL